MRILSIAFALLFGFQVSAQENVFLSRDFWKESPNKEAVENAIKAGHNPAEANSNNFDGVVYAILENAPNATIEYLISKEGNGANKLTHDGRTYIFWAAYKGNTDLMVHLLKLGAKTDLTDDKGNTILNFAASSGQQNTKVYDLCLKHGANLKTDLTPSGANALLLAAPHDKEFSLINYFTEKGLSLNSVDANGNGVFNYVARTGNIPLLEQLLSKGAKGTDEAFIFACQGTRGTTNGLEVYEFLERVGLNPNVTTKEGDTPLHVLASRSKDVEIISYFIKKGLDINQVNEEGNNALMLASYRNNLEIIQLFLDQTKDVNTVNKKGQSALTNAVAYNTPETVLFLINKGADISVIDTEGNTLIAYLLNTYSSRNKEVFMAKWELLNAKGLDVTKPQANGNTLYHLAVSNGDMELLKFVANFKSDINAKNKEGLTPLHLAAMKAQDDTTLKYLLELGAKKDSQTDFEETAFDLASENEILKQQKISIDFLK